MYYDESFVNGNSLPDKLPKKEVIECFQKFHEGDIKAKNKIIEHNLRLVKWIAQKFNNTGIEEDELVSVGTIGLIKSVNTFAIDKNIEFATYASRCIENEMLMYLRYNKKFKDTSNLEDILNTDFDGNEIKLGDIIPDEKAEFEDRVINDRFNSKIKQTVKELLSEREYIIINYLYALDGIYKTQKEIAEILNLSQSYISRIEKKALGKLQRIEEKISEVKEYNAFDIHEIDEEIDFETFANLLRFFPTWEIKLYAKFRNINLDKQKIKPVKITSGGGLIHLN